MITELDCDVVVIGAGPAGLAAATALRHAGVNRVLVFEREPEAGGISRHCAHPPYGVREYGRLMTGPRYARRNVAAAEAAGVDIRTRHTVVALHPGGGLDLATPDGALRVAARRVLLTTGARETPRSARLISGDRPVGVINTATLQSALYLEHFKPFEAPVIVGTELVSLSAVMSCRRAGIRPVAVIERNPRPTARWPLTLFPRLCGIPVHLNTTLAGIEGRERVEGVQLAGPDGTISTLACDGVLLTGHFTSESSLARLAPHLAVDAASSGPVVDQYGRCSDPAYYAAGNVLRPIETAGWSWREGRAVAGFIAADLDYGLPAAEEFVPVRVAPPVKYCVPQRLVRSARPGLAELQLRVTEPVRGTLTVSDGTRPLWWASGAFLPERRIRIPLGDPAFLRAPALEIGFESPP
ncbi:NAD(P)/FAD-dependent oxidoreductase [Salinisphaera sp. LB1]|uniref:NAD(P)/FAD-dependent oxidoreductase n=1 Tax=Salinisphaera sp. LB1 TaxID=2183911 RepID=UPI000D7070C0|nr:FAD/NAD(P)-binding oxidoreductase [Salinisphaera sp. LB1]AWN15442.1 Sarcosine oxidase alpha subunit [Salinisphaera sp. LB1]